MFFWCPVSSDSCSLSFPLSIMLTLYLPPPRSIPTPYPPTLSLRKLSVPTRAVHVFLDAWPSLECGQPTRGYILTEKGSLFPSSYQGNSSSAWSGMQCSHFLEFCEFASLKFTQIRACCHNCCEFVCAVQRTLFPCRNPPPLALAIILFPLSQ